MVSKAVSDRNKKNAKKRPDGNGGLTERESAKQARKKKILRKVKDKGKKTY